MAVNGWQDAGCFMHWHDFCPPGHPERNQTPECPDWFFFGGYYYLVFGIGSVSRYLYSKAPLGPWICPEDNRKLLIGTNLINRHKERLVFAGAVSLSVEMPETIDKIGDIVLCTFSAFLVKRITICVHLIEPDSIRRVRRVGLGEDENSCTYTRVWLEYA